MILDLDRANEIMDEQKLDALVAFSMNNVFYSTGYYSMLSVLSKTPTSFAVIPRKGEPVLVLPADEEGLLMTGESVVKNYHFYGGVFGKRKEKPKDEGNEFKLIGGALRRAGAANGRVGYDGKILPKFQFDLLKAELDSAKLVEASNVFQRLRMIKSKEELERLRTSSELLETGCKAAYGAVRDGISETEFIHEFKKAVLAKEPMATFLQLETGFGKRGGIGGGTFASQYRAKKGDVIHFDGGVQFRQYSSDLARNATVGRASDQVERIYNACFKAEQNAIGLMKPGTKFEDLYKIALKTLREEGFSDYTAFYLGHSIGIEAHEWPTASPGSDQVLQEDMVVQLEIPYYLSEVGGFNTEDCIHITKDGPEYITTLKRELYEL